MENKNMDAVLSANFIKGHKTGTVVISGKTDKGKTTFLKDLLDELDNDKRVLFASTGNSGEIVMKDNYIERRLDQSGFEEIYEDSVRNIVDYLVLDDLKFTNETIEFINKCSEHTNVLCAFHSNKEIFDKSLPKVKNIRGAFNI